MTKEEIKKFEKYHRDGEIAFAISQLEKLKDEFGCCYFGCVYTPAEIADKIDEFINKLRGKKNG